MQRKDFMISNSLIKKCTQLLKILLKISLLVQKMDVLNIYFLSRYDS